MSEEIKTVDTKTKSENIDVYQAGYRNGYVVAKRKYKNEMLKEIQKEKERLKDIYEYYPYNVLYEAFGEVIGFNLDKYNISPKSILDYFESSLDPRERDIIELVYKYNKSLAFCGERFGITRERTRQLRDRVLVRLREPGQLELMEVVSKHDLLDAKDELQKMKLYFTENKIVSIPARKISSLPVGIRCKNALARCGIVDTRDLETLSFGQVKLITALGTKSRRELSEVLRNLGYTVNETNTFDYYICVK